MRFGELTTEQERFLHWMAGLDAWTINTFLSFVWLSTEAPG